MTWTAATIGVLVASTAFFLLLNLYRRTRQKLLGDAMLFAMVLWTRYQEEQDRAKDKPPT